MPNGKKVIIFIFIYLLCNLLISYSIIAQNVSVKDYTVPTSFSSSLFIDPNYDLTMVGKKIQTNRGSVGLVYSTFYESLPIGYSIDAIGSGSFEKNPKDGKYRNRYSMNISSRFKKFIWNEEDLFGSIKLDGNYYKSYDYPATSLTIGLGYGRFINATPLRKAVRMEDFLIKEDVISDHLPKEAMLELGHIIEKESEYEDRYGDIYRKNWFNDMENIIRESGMLKRERIGAIGILRMQEVLTKERINDRFYGWDVTIGTKIDISLPQKKQERNKPSIDISFRYSRPISWSTQFNERLSVNSPWGDKFIDVYNIKADTALAYEISNRINFLARHSFVCNQIDGGNRLVSNSLSLSFIYFLENHINLVATEQVEKISDSEPTTNFVISLNYRIF